MNFQLEPLLTRYQPSLFYAQMTLIQREPLELARRNWVLDPVHIFCCFRLLANESPYFLVPSPIELQCAGWQADKALDTLEIDLTQKSSIFCKRDIKFSSKRLPGRKCLILPRGFGLLYTEVPLTFDCIKDFVLPFSKQHIKG